MAGLESDVLSSGEETEVHTASDLEIVVISSGDSETGDGDLEPVEVKPEKSEDEEDWRQLAYYVPGHSDEEEGVQIEAEADVQAEEAEIVLPQEHKTEDDSGASTPSQQQLQEHSFAGSSSSIPQSDDVKSAGRSPFLQQQDEAKVQAEKMEVVSPPPRRRRGRPARIAQPLPDDGTWQVAPDPPAKKRKTSLKESLVWPHFLVPLNTNKATANVVKCRKCNQPVSRGKIARLNQSRGTSNMARHLFSYHSSQMTPEFLERFWHFAARSVPDSDAAVPSGSGESAVVTAPQSSVCPTLTGAEPSTSSGLVCAPSTLTGPPSSKKDVSDLFVNCAKCRTTIIGGDIPWAQWLDVIAAHKRSCVPK